MSSELIPSKFARSLLSLVEERGMNYQPLLAQSGITFDPHDLLNSKYRDDISVLEYSRLYQQVLSLLQDESFGLKSAANISPGAFRMLCYCIIGCDSLGHALRRAQDFYRIFFQDNAALSLSVEDGIARVRFHTDMPHSESITRGTAEVYGLCTWHRFCGWLIGKPLELREVRFSFPAPEIRDRLHHYQRLYACPLYFDNKNSGFCFDARLLDSLVVQDEASLKEFLRTAPYQLMVMPEDKGRNGLEARVRALVGQDFSQGFPSFERVADALNMSAPTLRRHLKKEGTSFQRIKDECRRDAAIAYLSRPELSINAVAILMGFTDPSAFHRSFKKWTGMPPGQFRETQLAGED